MLLIAFIFFRNERKELAAIGPQLGSAHPAWVIAGVLIGMAYILCQGGIYRKAFSSVELKLPWWDALILFLKRNFIGVFLPAGSISSLAYFPSQLRRHGFNQSKVYQASSLFGFAGMLTVFLIGLPVVVYTVIGTSRFKESWLGLVAISIVIIGLFLIYRSLKSKGKLFVYLENRFPAAAVIISQLTETSVNTQKFTGAVMFSLGVELTGIITVYVSMLAIGAEASLGVAAAAYVMAVIMMVVSPLLKGLGAVEVSMVYVLTEFGYSAADALSVTILFRVFEFWMPLLLGLLAFSWRGRRLFLRTFPVLLIFTVGIVNVISAITPPEKSRMKLLASYLPLEAIHASNVFVLFSGLALLITSAFLIRGMKNAWRVAVIITFLSLIGNITKALDYEEASLCLLTLIFLLSTGNQYKIQSSLQKIRGGMLTGLMVFAAVLIFGFVSFYFISPRHFGVDFTWESALIHTLKSFLLVEDTSITPKTRFAREYSMIIRSLGFFTWIYLLINLTRTNKHRLGTVVGSLEKARLLLAQYGDSAVGYFKTYNDKLIFVSSEFDGFVSYRVSGNFAIALEGPVCPVEDKMYVIREFQDHCYQMGLRTAYYRVSENNLPIYEGLKKNKLMIGQEAIVDIAAFSLEGRDRKSLRNGLNSLNKNGYTAVVKEPPHDEQFLAELRKVSDEWLNVEKTESVFSQGMFLASELQHQTVIYIQNKDGEVVAFLNVIPDYVPEECTYDLIRKKADSPPAAMDALIVRMIEYGRAAGKSFLNMGMVPMTGIDDSEKPAEMIIKVAGEKLKRFQHYKGLRFFKEKYAGIWENKYLIYDNELDLVQLPPALKNVMKPPLVSENSDEMK